MKKIRLLIVDDEHLAHNVLVEYASKIEYLEVVGSCYDALSTINFLNKTPVDALLLDIQMPDLTGIELIQTLEKACPKIIFTTAHTEYALESFSYDQVIDYLHKPIRLNRFVKSMERLKGQIELEKAAINKNSVETSEAEVKKQYLSVKDNKVIYKIPFDEVTYIQAWGNYVKIFTTPEKVQIGRITIKELEDQLPSPGFLRIHKSYIVNSKKVTAIDGNQVVIGDSTLPIGKSYSILVKNEIMR